MKNILIPLVSIAILINTTSCKKENLENDCSDVFCTLQFVTISVSIKDSSQVPVALDYYSVSNVNTGQVDVSKFGTIEMARELGQYPIAADGSVGYNQTASLIFKGYIDSIEVISSSYTVGHDCCHINLVSGEVDLVLD